VFGIIKSSLGRERIAEEFHEQWTISEDCSDLVEVGYEA